MQTLLEALPAASRVLEIGAGGDALARAYRSRHPGAVWQQALAKRQPPLELIVLHDSASPGACEQLATASRHAAASADLYVLADNRAHWQTLQGLIEGDLDSGPVRALPALFKRLMDLGWMPSLEAELACEAPAGSVAQAALELARALDIPAATMQRNLGRGAMLIHARRSCGDPASFVAGARRARFAVVVPVTREQQLRLNVEASPGLAEVGARIVTVRGARSAAEALQKALAQCDADWVLLCHQDVYFARSFGHRLEALLAGVAPDQRATTLIGFAGIGVDTKRQGFERAGFVIDRSARFDHPASDAALSMDELGVVLARDSVHRIDPALGWHLWATDLCLAAICTHKTFARIVRMPAFHNSVNDYRLPAAFDASAARLAAKYPDFGPIHTLCGTLDTRCAVPRGEAAPRAARAPAPRSITTLVPAYKFDYLGELLLGLATQSFKDFRVVLSDDSPGGRIGEAIASGAFAELTASLDLHVVQGPRQGSFKNIQFLLDTFGRDAPLVHVHLDDDVIYPDFYRAHALAHTSRASGASVSLRWLTASDGRPQQTLPLPQFLDAHAERVLWLGPDALYTHTVPCCENWLGELSNMVLSQEAARRYRDSTLHGLSYYGLGDIGVLLDVSRQVPVALVRDHLSGFRSNPQQTSAQTGSFAVRCGFVAWAALALAAWREGRISEAQARRSLATTLARCRAHHAADTRVAAFIAIAERHAEDLERLFAAFAPFWSDMLESDPDSRSQPHPVAEAALAC